MFGGLGSGGGGGGGGGGASQPAGPSGLFGVSILGNSTNQQQQQQQQQQPPNQQSQSGPVNAQPAYFNHLLERGKKRTNQDKDAQQLGELPTLQLGLGDIARKVRDLGHGSAASQTARGVDSRGLVACVRLNFVGVRVAKMPPIGIICWLLPEYLLALRCEI